MGKPTRSTRHAIIIRPQDPDGILRMDDPLLPALFRTKPNDRVLLIPIAVRSVAAGVAEQIGRFTALAETVEVADPGFLGVEHFQATLDAAARDHRVVLHGRRVQERDGTGSGS